MADYEVYSTGSKWAYHILATGVRKNGFATKDAAEAEAKTLVPVSEPEKPSKRGKKEVEVTISVPAPLAEPEAQLPVVSESAPADVEEE